MKCYAIIPAAGRSRRMGTPKLLLPWQLPGGDQATMIDCVLQTWTRSRAARTVVVVNPHNHALIAACQRWAVDVLIPGEETSDMKASIRLGMQHLQQTFQPTQDDWCFLAPADLPTLATEVIDEMIKAAKDPHTLVVPVYGEKSSHPVLLSWSKLQEIKGLPEHQGVDQIVSRSPSTRVLFPPELRPRDVDTPDQYEALKRQWDAS